MTPADITQKMLVSWGGADIFNQALKLAKAGAVLRSDYDPKTFIVSGEIVQPGGLILRSRFRLRDDGTIDSFCPCIKNQQYGLVCVHVVALGILLMMRNVDPAREEKYQAEQRTARRIAQIDPAAYIQRSPRGTPSRVALAWGPGFVDEFYRGGVTVTLAIVGANGVRRRPEDIPHGEALALPPADDDLLSVLEDVCEGPAKSSLTLGPADFLNILDLRPHEGPVKAILKAEYFEDDGQFDLFPFAELPFPHVASADRFLVHGNAGFVYAEGRFFKMANVLPPAFQSVYVNDEIISRETMPGFIRTNLPMLRRLTEVQLSPSEDMFQFVPDAPVFHVQLSGSRASLAAVVEAHYGTTSVVCTAAAPADAVCRPDPEDKLLYHVRNPATEQAALALLRTYGFEPGTGVNALKFFVTDPRRVLNFLGSGVPYLRRNGWRVEYSERLQPVAYALPMIMPNVQVTDAPHGAFDVGYSYMAGDRVLDPRAVQAAINRGESFLLDGGETLLIDTEAIEAMRAVFNDCAASQNGAAKGKFRVAGAYGPYVKRSLDAISDGIAPDYRCAPKFADEADLLNRDAAAEIPPVELGDIARVLRPYQKTGVYWMRAIEERNYQEKLAATSPFGRAGLLADEMGLGKTLQTLAWLSLVRVDPAARGKPALVVCPTSLVENWHREAEKFVPKMKCLVVSGPGRADAFKKIPQMELVITSYALLQRDFDDAYADKTFSVVVLDEAQHIKNRTTRNARAAKGLAAIQRLVLTGTPVENSVADVWSIFDFLMPGYLGNYETFRAGTEEPIAAGGKDGATAQANLRNKLHSLILRRLKKDVAKDLPDKIIRTEFCPMTPDQQRVYTAILTAARGKIGNMVKEKGFQKSRFEILALLMRLRQVSCHLGLLKEYREGKIAKVPEDQVSGKLDSFFEFLDEAIDGGHRVLVFSQFVQMLTLLRQELEKRGLSYCYLDGETKDRLGECQRFNTDRSIPLFLISLHAGGTGLNLTGADMVVHFDPWWNPAVEDQATDRAHRIGQKKTVYVVKMIAEHSVEEKVLALQKKKQLVINATVGTTDAAAMEKLTYDDVKAIVGL